jgi:hypothetical protein
MSVSRVGLLVLGLCVTAGWGQSSAQPTEPGDKAARGEKGDKGEKQRKPKFTISKETTYVNGPLRKDGTIDYVAALNKRLSQGVTPDNNANVLFWKAFGPHPERAKMPPEFFKWLGYQPPERGEYFADLYSHLRQHFKGDPDRQKEVDDLFERVTGRPWTARQYPQVTAYLKANAKPLALVVEGTKRSHYFMPLVPGGDEGLIGALIPSVQKCRGFASALSARAMLHLDEGRYDDAWQDLLACHRLGRLVSRGGTLIEELVGIAIDAIAARADLVYLERARMDARQIKDRLRDLQRLPPMSPVAEHIDLGERFMFLDIVMMVARGGPRLLEGFAGGRPPKALSPEEKEALAKIDWDPALRTGNRWYDRMAAAMRLKDRGARQEELEKLYREVKALKASLSKDQMEILAQALLGLTQQAPKTIGKTIGDVMITMLVPAVHKVQQAEDRAAQTQRNLEVAFALAAYRADHERYPEKLEALAPNYLAAVPGDLFSGKALVYRPSEKGYLLYSVGVNGMDDGGRSYEDNPPGDDLVVRVPLPELRRK